MQIIKIKKRYNDCVVFFVESVRLNAPSIFDQFTLDGANGYADIYKVPKGSLFIQIYDVDDELQAMARALDIMETPEFKLYYEKHKQ